MRHAPDWVAGISIGAINAALIAGNPPERRVDAAARVLGDASRRFRSPPRLPAAPAERVDGARDIVNETNATIAMLFGVAGFFSPRVPAAPFQPPGTPAAISYYDTEPLRRTLERLVDFDLLNSGAVRLSVGAVNVTHRQLRLLRQPASSAIDARHIMASGALPPGFPPVEIDGEFYWDGGLVSNTPLQYVLDQPGTRPRLVFQVDLFAARGEMPANLAEVERAREGHPLLEPDAPEHDRTSCDRQATLQAARASSPSCRRRCATTPTRRRSPRCRSRRRSTVVHLIYRSKHYESQSKDYEFSRASMHEHWAAGLADTARHARGSALAASASATTRACTCST